MLEVLVLSVYAMFLSVCGLTNNWEMLRLGIFVPMSLVSFVIFVSSIGALINGPLTPNSCARVNDLLKDGEEEQK